MTSDNTDQGEGGGSGVSSDNTEKGEGGGSGATIQTREREPAQNIG